MLPYFPFNTSFDKMGTSALPSENLIVEADEHYCEEIILKRKLLMNDHAYYYQASPVTKQPVGGGRQNSNQLVDILSGKV